MTSALLRLRAILACAVERLRRPSLCRSEKRVAGREKLERRILSLFVANVRRRPLSSREAQDQPFGLRTMLNGGHDSGLAAATSDADRPRNSSHMSLFARTFG